MSTYAPLAIADGLILLGVLALMFIGVVTLYTRRGTGITKHPHSGPTDAPGAEVDHGPGADKQAADELMDGRGSR